MKAWQKWQLSITMSTSRLLTLSKPPRLSKSLLTLLLLGVKRSLKKRVRTISTKKHLPPLSVKASKARIIVARAGDFPIALPVVDGPSPPKPASMMATMSAKGTHKDSYNSELKGARSNWPLKNFSSIQSRSSERRNKNLRRRLGAISRKLAVQSQFLKPVYWSSSKRHSQSLLN